MNRTPNVSSFNKPDHCFRHNEAQKQKWPGEKQKKRQGMTKHTKILLKKRHDNLVLPGTLVLPTTQAWTSFVGAFESVSVG